MGESFYRKREPLKGTPQWTNHPPSHLRIDYTLYPEMCSVNFFFSALFGLSGRHEN